MILPVALPTVASLLNTELLGRIIWRQGEGAAIYLLGYSTCNNLPPDWIEDSNFPPQSSGINFWCSGIAFLPPWRPRTEMYSQVYWCRVKLPPTKKHSVWYGRIVNRPIHDDCSCLSIDVLPLDPNSLCNLLRSYGSSYVFGSLSRFCWDSR